jgi:hypothetical protein
MTILLFVLAWIIMSLPLAVLVGRALDGRHPAA